ncbi:MAG: hypothetical protein OEY79_04795 [Anaplasmataceae bacterium]|nr:hypothetical protein [Anaplasmataceae bacterium]
MIFFSLSFINSNLFTQILKFFITIFFSLLILFKLYPSVKNLYGDFNLIHVFAADNKISSNSDSLNDEEAGDNIISINKNIENELTNKTSNENHLLVLEHLKSRYNYIEEYDQIVKNKESALFAQKSYIEKRIKELNVLHNAVLDDIKEYRNIELERIKVLVKIYENMKPDDAAQIFDTLDNKLLIEVMRRMKEIKTALILAKMRPERARDITVKLAGKMADFSTYMCNNNEIVLEDSNNNK